MKVSIRCAHFVELAILHVNVVLSVRFASIYFESSSVEQSAAFCLLASQLLGPLACPMLPEPLKAFL